MKRVLLAGVIAIAALAGCSAAQQANVAANAQKVQVIITDGCSIVQPTLVSVQTMDPAIAPFVLANGAFCAAAANVNVSSLQQMVNTSIPAAMQLVTNSTLIPANQKPLVVGGLTAFQVALSSAMILLQTVPVATPTAPVPASTLAVPASGASA